MTNILLAEDSPTQSAMIRGLLEAAGFDVRCAGDGNEALAEFEQQQPEVLVTDLMMPNMNGCELTQAVVEQYPETPVLVITARGSEGLAVDALAYGAVNFVPKQLIDARLPQVLGELTERVRADKQCTNSGANLVVPELIFEIESDMRAISLITRYVQKTLAFADAIDVVSRYRITSAITSALVNAICYGNLEMRDDEEQIYELIRGERDPAKVPHKARLVISVGIEDTRISVAHEGPGASCRTTPAPGTPGSFELEDCRGLLLITSFMDQVIFNQNRNEIVMVKNSR